MSSFPLMARSDAKAVVVPSDEMRGSRSSPCPILWLGKSLNFSRSFHKLVTYLGSLWDQETLPTFSNSQGAWTEELRAHSDSVLIL
jgi:hypothetical protein